MSPYQSVILEDTLITADFTSDAQLSTPPLERGHIIVNVSAYTGGSITPQIIATDPASGITYPILIGPVINSVGYTILKIGPAIAAYANLASTDFLPDGWQIQLVTSGGTNLNASIGLLTGP